MTDGLTALILRIALRYFALPIAIWFGAPEDVVREILSDPDTLALSVVLFGGMAAAIEGWTTLVRARGGKT